jgi:hypothetical protein
MIDIPVMHLLLYNGSMDATARMNLTSQNLPYSIDYNLAGIQIEKLKLDTPVKKEDISGTLQSQGKINGFSLDLARLNGTGQISIHNGKLWQLNLFKGLGVLLFTTDFTNVVFNEGSCTYLVQNKTVSTDNLRLKSNLADLAGTLKVGFDGSLEGSLDVQVSDNAPLTGTFKDVTTAILGQARRCGMIKIDGTLKEPKYKFKTCVVDILGGIKQIFLLKQ